MSTPRKNQTKPKSEVTKIKEKLPREARVATSPETRELQLVNLAVNLAEKQLMEGTASAAVMTHFLKIGSKREVLERQILEEQASFLKAKASNLNQDKDTQRIAEEALEALKSYKSGSSNENIH